MRQPDGTWRPAISHAPELVTHATLIDAQRQVAAFSNTDTPEEYRIITLTPDVYLRHGIPLAAPITRVTSPEGQRVTFRKGALTHAYIAHRFNAPEANDRIANRIAAARWVGWLSMHLKIVPHCSWLTLVTQWGEEHRDLGLQIDFAQIERCDIFVAVGPVMSSGMRLEAQHATENHVPVFDLTGYGVSGEIPCIKGTAHFETFALSRGYDLARFVR